MCMYASKEGTQSQESFTFIIFYYHVTILTLKPSKWFGYKFRGRDYFCIIGVAWNMTAIIIPVVNTWSSLLDFIIIPHWWESLVPKTCLIIPVG